MKDVDEVGREFARRADAFLVAPPTFTRRVDAHQCVSCGAPWEPKCSYCGRLNLTAPLDEPTEPV